jgi:cytochrome d ubiquinol oxidase subunit II
MDLITLWACLLAFAILLYVVLDGFSLGIALLFPSTRNEEERDTLVDSIAPVWDANQPGWYLAEEPFLLPFQ